MLSSFPSVPQNKGVTCASASGGRWREWAPPKPLHSSARPHVATANLPQLTATRWPAVSERPRLPAKKGAQAINGEGNAHIAVPRGQGHADSVRTSQQWVQVPVEPRGRLILHSRQNLLLEQTFSLLPQPSPTLHPQSEGHTACSQGWASGWRSMPTCYQGCQLLCGTQPLLGSWTNGSVATTPPFFGAVSQKGRESRWGPVAPGRPEYPDSSEIRSPGSPCGACSGRSWLRRSLS